MVQQAQPPSCPEQPQVHVVERERQGAASARAPPGRLATSNTSPARARLLEGIEPGFRALGALHDAAIDTLLSVYVNVIPDCPTAGSGDDNAAPERPQLGFPVSLSTVVPQTYTITELSREFDVTPRAIRFFTRPGPPCRRRGWGRSRVYRNRDRAPAR